MALFELVNGNVFPITTPTLATVSLVQINQTTVIGLSANGTHTRRP